MGLFSFGKRKQPPKGNGPSPEYAVAHLFLRHMALSDPVGFLAIVASPDAQKFFEGVLHDVAEMCGRSTNYDAGAIKRHGRRIEGFPCAVIEFPAPEEMVGAYMVAAVALVDVSSGDLSDVGEVKARYFTLEKGMPIASEPRTVLGEWTASTHSNYGDGPPPTVEAFVEAIRAVLGNRRP